VIVDLGTSGHATIHGGSRVSGTVHEWLICESCHQMGERGGLGSPAGSVRTPETPST